MCSTNPGGCIIPAPEPTCSCQTHCTAPNPDCPLCKDDITKCGIPLQDNPNVPRADPVYSGRVKGTLKNCDVKYIYCNRKDSGTYNMEEGFLTSDNDYTFYKEVFASSWLGYVIFFVRPHENHLLTSFRVGNANNKAHIFQLDTIHGGNLHHYPLFDNMDRWNALREELRSQGYVAGFGYYKGNQQNQSFDTQFQVIADVPKIQLTVTPDATEYEVGQTATFAYSIVPVLEDAVDPSMYNMAGTITAGDQVISLSTPTGQYVRSVTGQFEHTITDADFERGGVAVQASADTQLAFNYTVQSESDTFDILTSGPASDTDTVIVPVRKNLTVTYDWGDLYPTDGTETKPENVTIAAGSKHQVASGYAIRSGVKGTTPGIWSFQGWNLPEGIAKDTNGEITVNQNIAITGQWTFTPIYTVTYQWADPTDIPTDSSVVLPSSATVNAGESHTVAPGFSQVAGSRNGIPGTWTFDGWQPPQGVTVTDGAFVPTGDTVLTGSWTFVPNRYTVSYQWADSRDIPTVDSVVLPGSATVNAGETHTVAPGFSQITGSRNGIPGTWTFDGWQPPQGVTITNGAFVPTGNTVLTGSWTFTPTQYTVTYTDGVDSEELFANEPHTCTYSTATSSYGTIPTFTSATPTRPGYLFDGWKYSGTNATYNNLVYRHGTHLALPVTENLMLIAQWKSAVYFRFEAKDHGAITSNNAYQAIAVNNGKATPTAVILQPESGYALDYWADSAGVQVATPFTEHTVTPGSTYTYYAYFAPDANGDGIPDKYQKKITFLVINGKWLQVWSDTRTVYVTLVDSQGRPSATGTASLTAPTDMVAKLGYGNGAWDATPPTQVSGTADVTYIYRYVKKTPTWNPNTGDIAPIGLWTVLGTASILAVLALSLRKKKRRWYI